MCGVVMGAFALLPAALAHAQSPAEFSKGRNVDLYIGSSVGGAYDLYARVLARALGKHTPGNPTITPKNMEGAGSLRLANWLYNVGPKNGTALGTIGRGTAFDPLLGSKGAQFQADKFTWVGSANNEASICVAWKGSGIARLEDVLTKELIVGGTGQAADTHQLPRTLNRVRGADEGSRIPRRPREGGAGDHAGWRRGGREAGQGPLSDAESARGQGRGVHPALAPHAMIAEPAQLPAPARRCRICPPPSRGR